MCIRDRCMSVCIFFYFENCLTFGTPWAKNGRQNFKKTVKLCKALNFEEFYSNYELSIFNNFYQHPLQILNHLQKLVSCVCKKTLHIVISCENL